MRISRFCHRWRLIWRKATIGVAYPPRTRNSEPEPPRPGCPLLVQLQGQRGGRGGLRASVGPDAPHRVGDRRHRGRFPDRAPESCLRGMRGPAGSSAGDGSSLQGVHVHTRSSGRTGGPVTGTSRSSADLESRSRSDKPVKGPSAQSTVAGSGTRFILDSP